MALIGGGGAGNVSGGNPSGTGTSLNYIGDHCYAYSGIVGANNVETTLVLFDTANQYIVSKTQLMCAVSTGDDTRYKIYFNDIIVIQFGIDTSGQYGTEEDPSPAIDLIVPPYTTVKITAANVTNTNSLDQTATFTGRVY